MSNDDFLGNFDPGRVYGHVPTKEVFISDNALSAMQSSTPYGANFDSTSVSVPDLEALGMDDLNTESLLAENWERRKKKIEHKTWEALFDVAEASDRKTVNASGTGRFVDTLMDGSQQLHKQGGEPEDAFLFMNSKTKGYVDEWMGEEVRFNSPTGDLTDASNIQVGGISFQAMISPHPDPDQIVMVGDEMHAAPQTVPCVVINNLPIGVEIRIEVDGEDNNIVVIE